MLSLSTVILHQIYLSAFDGFKITIENIKIAVIHNLIENIYYSLRSNQIS